jgi:Fungal Zn(2)-Cys(6) binuclear cluster domain
MEIDPRLRSDTSSGNPYPPLHRPSSSAPTPIAANPNRPPLPQYHSGPDGAQQSGYPPRTPQSVSNIGPADLHGEGSPDAGSGDAKRPRACEACRGLKVRCELDTNNPEGPCKRCAKASRNCVVTVPSRKRQKKTDSRVAELEKKIDALTASLQATKSRSISVGHGSEAEGDRDTPNNAVRTNSYEQVTIGGFGATFEQRTGSDWVPPDRHARLSENDGKPVPPPMVIAGQKRKYQEGRDYSIVTTTPSANRGK